MKQKVSAPVGIGVAVVVAAFVFFLFHHYFIAPSTPGPQMGMGEISSVISKQTQNRPLTKDEAVSMYMRASQQMGRQGH